MKDRIKKIIELQHMTQQEFAECIKVAPATLSSIFTGRTAPSLKIVEAIKNRFPDISTDWLMFGRGAMTDYHAVEESSHSDVSARASDAGSSSAAQNAASAGASVSHQQSTSGMDDGQDETARAANQVQQTSAVDFSERGITGISAVANTQDIVKKYYKRERSIVEIRIFYDDQTWETFVPKNS